MTEKVYVDMSLGFAVVRYVSELASKSLDICVRVQCGWEGVISNSFYGSVTTPKTCMRLCFSTKLGTTITIQARSSTISQFMNWSIATKIVYLRIPNQYLRLIVNSRAIANNFQVSKVVLLH